MNKFKVFNTQTKKWLDEKDFYINSAGELCVYNRPVICKVLEHVVPVFSTGKVDKFGEELFIGDEVEVSGNVNDHGWNKGDIFEIIWNNYGFSPLCNNEDDYEFLNSEDLEKLTSIYKEQ